MRLACSMLHDINRSLGYIACLLMHNINEVALSPLSSSFNRGEPPSEVIIEGPKSIITGDENKEELQVQVCVVLYFVTATEAEKF